MAAFIFLNGEHSNNHGFDQSFVELFSPLRFTNHFDHKSNYRLERGISCVWGEYAWHSIHS